MRNFLLIISICFITACVTSNKLVELHVKQSPVENGKTLEMTFREIERNQENSIAEVTFISGGSVSSSLFTLRGACSIARARNEKYFTSTEISSNPTRYKFTFLKSITPEQADPKSSNHAFSSRDCSLLRF